MTIDKLALGAALIVTGLSCAFLSALVYSYMPLYNGFNLFGLFIMVGACIFFIGAMILLFMKNTPEKEVDKQP